MFYPSKGCIGNKIPPNVGIYSNATIMSITPNGWCTCKYDDGREIKVTTKAIFRASLVPQVENRPRTIKGKQVDRWFIVGSGPMAPFYQTQEAALYSITHSHTEGQKQRAKSQRENPFSGNTHNDGRDRSLQSHFRGTH